jgi:hypothetical protein
MTVQSTTARADYDGNGATTLFPIPFYFLLNTDLTVILTDEGVLPVTVVTLALGTDYTVAGVANPAGGSITTTLAPTSTQRISILRSVPYTQLKHYVPNDPFPAASHEVALDKLTMETQQLAEVQSRALTLPPNTDPSTVSPVLPPPESNKLIGWNQAADALQNVDAGTLATIVAYGTANADLFSGNGVQTAFALTANPGVQANLDVAISGVTQRPGIDYTWAGGTTLTFTVAPPVGTNNVLARYMQGLPQGFSDSGASAFSHTTLYGPGSVGLALQTAINIKNAPYNARLDGVTDDTAALFSANARAVAVGSLLLIPGPCHVASPITVTAPLVDTVNSMFSLTSQVTIDNGLPVRPEWFGTAASPYRAAQALPQPRGGVVALRNRTYPSCGFAYNGVFMDRDNLVFRGEQMPQLANDCRSLTGGTIINGTFYVYANNVTIENLGIDTGAAYLGAGVPNDAMICSYGNDALKTAGTLKKGLRLHNVIGLCKTPSGLTHSMLAGEGYTDVTLTGDITGCYGTHGVVLKCRQVKGAGASINGYLNDTEGFIIKTDSHGSDASTDVSIGSVNVFQDGPDGWAPYLTSASASSIGVLIHAFAGNIGNTKVGHINERGHSYGMKWQIDGNYIIDNVQIDSVTTETNSISGVSIETGFALASYQRCQIGLVVARNAPLGAVFVWQTAADVSIDQLRVVNCATAAVAASAVANPVIHTLMAENCAAVWQITSTAKPRCGQRFMLGSTSIDYTSAGGGQVPTLAGTWAQFPGEQTWGVELNNYGVRLRGLLSPGAGVPPVNNVINLPQFARPPQNLRVIGVGSGGAGYGPVPITVGPAGIVVINEAAGGVANASTWMSLAGIAWAMDL